MSRRFLFAAAFLFILGSIFPQNSTTQSLKQKQPDNHRSLWEQVDKLESTKQTRSIIDLIKKIQDQSLEEKNYPEYVKTILAGFVFNDRIVEKKGEFNISYLKARIKTATFPIKNILQSVLADIYLQYNKFDRKNLNTKWDSEAADDTIPDYTNMRIEKLTAEVISLYTQSLENADSLKKLPIEQYSGFLSTPNEEAKVIYVSLYDLLTTNAINSMLAYRDKIKKYSERANEIENSAGKVELYKKFNFQRLHDFILSDLNEYKNYGIDYTILKLMQNQLKHSITSKNNFALIFFELQRINYFSTIIRDFYTSAEYTDYIYLFLKEHDSDKYSSLINYSIAKAIKDAAGTAGLSIKKAVAECDKAIAKGENTIGGKYASGLKAELLEKDITAEYETSIIPGKPALMLLRYKNVDTFYAKIIPDSIRNFYRWGFLYTPDLEGILEALLSLKPLVEFSQPLPNRNDYIWHSTELIMPPLPSGSYTLLISTNADFRSRDAKVMVGFFQASNLSLSLFYSGNNSPYVLVTDSRTGASVENVKIEYNTQRTLNKKNVTFTDTAYTDSNGLFSPRSREILEMILTKGIDRYAYIENRYGNWYPDYYRTGLNGLFTDRQIYRPGDTVRFKGIAANGFGGQPLINPNTVCTLKIQDLNNKEIFSKKYTSNKFGSFSGVFPLPENAQPGRYSISFENTYASFQVEEFKRPKLLVDTKPIPVDCQPGDTVFVHGTVRTYAGYPISGAKIVYSAIAKSSIYEKGNNGTRTYKNQEGVVFADSKGEYVIKIPPQQSAATDSLKGEQTYFTLNITATDAAGESCSHNKSFTITYTLPMVNVDAPKNAAINTNYKITVTTTNIMSIPLSADLNIKIFKLPEEKKISFKRGWDKPEKFTIPEKDYTQFNLEDENENKIREDKLTPLFEKRIKCDGKYEFTLDPDLNLKAGKYFIRVTAKGKLPFPGTGGLEFTLWDPDAKKLNGQALLKTFGLKTKVEAGDTAKVIIGSSLKNKHVLYLICHGNNILKKEWITLNDEQKIINIPVTPADRGNLLFKAITFHDNHFVTESEVIEVPWTDKKLNVSFESFRDKLKPGSDETWKVKILDYVGKPAFVEILAGMYDASLDVYKPHYWNYFPFPKYSYTGNTTGFHNAISTGRTNYLRFKFRRDYYPVIFPYQINYFGLSYDSKPQFAPYNIYKPWSENSYPPIIKHYQKTFYGISGGRGEGDGIDYSLIEVDAKPAMIETRQELKVQAYSFSDDLSGLPGQKQAPVIQIRKDFSPTAFFFPAIYTKDGVAEITFTVPDAIIKWKFMLLAHTKDLAIASAVKEVITQKDFAIEMNPPRFLRSGDTLKLAAGINNISEKSIKGKAVLTLTDQATGRNLDKEFALQPEQSFTSSNSERCCIEWQIIVPEGITSSVVYRAVAYCNDFSDGEQNVLPVLSNRIKIKEGIPVHLKANANKNIKLHWFTNKSETLQKNSLMFEFTSNPAWLVKDAMASVITYPWECSEQTFNKYFTSKLAQPLIKPDLTDSTDLKNGKKSTVSLCDSIFIKNQPSRFFDKLKSMLGKNGAWPWFPGMQENFFFTNYILEGFGKLKEAGLLSKDEINEINTLTAKAINYCDYVNSDTTLIIGFNNIYYLYARSFYKDVKLAPQHLKRFNAVASFIKHTWPSLGLTEQALSALALYRMGDVKIATEIMNSIKQNAVYNDETGMFFNNDFFSWCFSPIITHCLISEGFNLILNDDVSSDLLKTWLLNKRQTANWGTTMENAAAAYVMAVNNSAWLNENNLPGLKIGNKNINVDKLVDKNDKTGSFKITWNKEELNSDMSTAVIKNNNKVPAWGGFIFSYSELSGKVLKSKSGLDISRKFFIKETVNGKDIVSPLDSNYFLKPGDHVIVRLYVNSEKDIDYVHIEDNRGSGFEPVDLLSGIKYNNGVYMYETIRDVSTSFFIEHLPAGKYVIEYPVRAALQGVYSCAPAMIESMYAPSFTSHTAGSILRIRK